ncbi:MAG: hypothetical protein IPJ94_24825 [Chloroflexi bacterium]|nr:hypothetical protein [Chloroflexota bacterium]
MGRLASLRFWAAAAKTKDIVAAAATLHLPKATAKNPDQQNDRADGNDDGEEVVEAL